MGRAYRWCGFRHDFGSFAFLQRLYFAPSRYHPSRQVSDYRWALNNYQPFIEREIKHVGVAYCYKSERGMQTYKVLYDKDYDDYIKECKPYTKKTKDSLVKVLLANLQSGNGQEVYNRL